MTKVWLSVVVTALLASVAYAQDVPPPDAVPPPGGNAHLAWADVLRADPVQAVVNTAVPQQQCYDQEVVQQNPGHKGVGTVLGAVIGGVLGNTIGRGGGRAAATVGGAVVGGAVGNHVASSGSTSTATQTVCQPVDTASQQRQIVGYDVEYRYHGEIYTSRLSYDPGERLRVRVEVDPAE